MIIHKVKTIFFSTNCSNSCVFIAFYSQSTSSELQDCSVTYENDVISAMCSYSGGSSVTGFQMIVQLNNITEVHKLYINSTTEHLSPGPVTVRVEESGTYHVAIFPIMGEMGIVDTTIAHSEVLSVTSEYDSYICILYYSYGTRTSPKNLSYTDPMGLALVCIIYSGTSVIRDWH